MINKFIMVLVVTIFILFILVAVDFVESNVVLKKTVTTGSEGRSERRTFYFKHEPIVYVSIICEFAYVSRHAACLRT